MQSNNQVSQFVNSSKTVYPKGHGVRHFVTFMRYLCAAAKLVYCCFVWVCVFFQIPLIKWNQDVVAGSHKINESILPKIFTQTWVKNGCPGLANPCVISFFPSPEHHWGESLWKMCVVGRAQAAGAKILLHDPAVINTNSNDIYCRHLPVLVLHDVADLRF